MTTRAISAMSIEEMDRITVSLAIDGERYTWSGNLSNLKVLRRAVGQSACDPLLSLTWADANFVHEHIRKHIKAKALCTMGMTLTTDCKHE